MHSNQFYSPRKIRQNIAQLYLHFLPDLMKAYNKQKGFLSLLTILQLDSDMKAQHIKFLVVTRTSLKNQVDNS